MNEKVYNTKTTNLQLKVRDLRQKIIDGVITVSTLEEFNHLHRQVEDICEEYRVIYEGLLNERDREQLISYLQDETDFLGTLYSLMRDLSIYHDSRAILLDTEVNLEWQDVWTIVSYDFIYRQMEEMSARLSRDAITLDEYALHAEELSKKWQSSADAIEAALANMDVRKAGRDSYAYFSALQEAEKEIKTAQKEMIYQQAKKAVVSFDRLLKKIEDEDVEENKASFDAKYSSAVLIDWNFYNSLTDNRSKKEYLELLIFNIENAKKNTRKNKLRKKYTARRGKYLAMLDGVKAKLTEEQELFVSSTEIEDLIAETDKDVEIKQMISKGEKEYSVTQEEAVTSAMNYYGFNKEDANEFASMMQEYWSIREAIYSLVNEATRFNDRNKKMQVSFKEYGKEENITILKAREEVFQELDSRLQKLSRKMNRFKEKHSLFSENELENFTNEEKVLYREIHFLQKNVKNEADAKEKIKNLRKELYQLNTSKNFWDFAKVKAFFKTISIPEQLSDIYTDVVTNIDAFSKSKKYKDVEKKQVFNDILARMDNYINGKSLFVKEKSSIFIKEKIEKVTHFLHMLPKNIGQVKKIKNVRKSNKMKEKVAYAKPVIAAAAMGTALAMSIFNGGLGKNQDSAFTNTFKDKEMTWDKQVDDESSIDMQEVQLTSLRFKDEDHVKELSPEIIAVKEKAAGLNNDKYVDNHVEMFSNIQHEKGVPLYGSYENAIRDVEQKKSRYSSSEMPSRVTGVLYAYNGGTVWVSADKAGYEDMQLAIEANGAIPLIVRSEFENGNPEGFIYLSDLTLEKTERRGR